LFHNLSCLLVIPWVKVLVLVVTALLLSCGLYGLISLRMEFRPEWLMDPKSESKSHNFHSCSPLFNLVCTPYTVGWI
jgi:hypothetical protein